MKKQVLFIVLMLMPLMASAQTEINGIYYNLNSTDNVAEVTSFELFVPYYWGHITIPKTVTYEGVTYSVTSIGDYAFYDCSGLTSVTIPNSVTSIGESAFEYCSGLTSITIPNSVTSIGERAFSYCSGLTSITIPSSVTHIGVLAFAGCYGLNSVHITDLAAWCNLVFSKMEETTPSANPLTFAQHLFLNGEEVKELVIPDGVTSIGNFTFSNCKALMSVSIPNSVISIGKGAFSGCSGLTSLTIPNSVKSIGDDWDGFGICGAFEGCFGLTNVNIHDGVTSISDGTFKDCSGLISVTIPKSVTSIGGGAFDGCTELNSVHITDLAAWCNISFFDSEFGFGNSNPLLYAHHLYLNGEEVKKLVVPDGVTSIEYVFSGCSSLTTVDIPNSVTSIGNSAFSGCSNLTSVSIPNSVTSIEGAAFSGCSNLTSVTIPNSVTSIESGAFYGCSKLSSVSLGKGIKSVGAKAFANCPEIKEVYCYAKDVPTISNDTFEDSYYIKFATLYVPESSVDLYKASAWSQFGNIVGITGGNEGERCAKPVITLLANGKIKVESSTEGATCVTNITASNAEPLSDGEISLNTPLTVYTVTSYATKEGYNDSEVATATFRYEKTEGDMNGDGMLNITDVIHLVNMILGQ